MSDDSGAMEGAVEPAVEDTRTDAPADAPATPGVDLARVALARARAAARARGTTDASPSRGQKGRQRGQKGARRAGSSVRSGSGPDDRDPQPLGAAISRLLAERGWETDAAVAHVLGRWPALVGPEMSAHCRPERFADGVLTVVTDSTAWATQVRLLAPQLVRRLNERLGHGTVQRVQVKGPGGPSWRRGPLSVRDGRGPRDTYG